MTTTLEQIARKNHMASTEEEVIEDINALLKQPTTENITTAARIFSITSKNFYHPIEKLLNVWLTVNDKVKTELVSAIRRQEINDGYAFDFVKANIEECNDPFYCVEGIGAKRDALERVFKPKFKDEQIKHGVVRHLSTLDDNTLNELKRTIKDNAEELYKIDSVISKEISCFSVFLMKNSIFPRADMVYELEANPNLFVKNSYQAQLMTYLVENDPELFLENDLPVSVDSLISVLNDMEEYGVKEFSLNDPIIVSIKEYVKNNEYDINRQSRGFFAKLETRNNLEYF